ncbi:MAG: NBR1-Ig-like domain-containing protein [Pelolinea sp.]|nr:NBR1-Ig-like domain-containing protein [Pelolinea sp.]
MKKNLLIHLLLIIGLFSASLACGITFAGTGSNTEGGEDTEARKLQLTVQALQMTKAASSQNQQQSSQQQPTSQQQSSSGPTPTVSPTPLPCNKPKFQYETIPDNTEFDPGENFTKSWTIRNDGTCTWNTNYKLVFVSGDRMSDPVSKNFTETVNPGEITTISMTLSAPLVNGEYADYWVIESDKGEKFGNYWAKIRVGPPPAAFAVTSVQLSLDTGADPKVIAKITASAAGTVTYKWQDNGGVEKSGSVKFTAAGTKSISTAVVLGSGIWVKLYIDSPNHQWFGPINVP